MSNRQIQPIAVQSIEEFISKTREHSQEWPYVWFRGEGGPRQDKTYTPLLPGVYRGKNADGKEHNENQLLQLFRMKAPVFGTGTLPESREAVDQWLFLAQHVGLPTRLLDWTESALVALYFALKSAREKKQAEPNGEEKKGGAKENNKKEEGVKAVVWMLNPIWLNEQSALDAGKQFPLTWVFPETNIGSKNIACAWQEGKGGVPLPVAILPTNIHTRMGVQRSCFTVHGTNNNSLKLQLEQTNDGASNLYCYEISPEFKQNMLKDLRLLGIGYSTIYPDLYGLAKELSELY